MKKFIKYNAVIIIGRGRLVAMAADCRSAYVSSILTPGSSASVNLTAISKLFRSGSKAEYVFICPVVSTGVKIAALYLSFGNESIGYAPITE